MKIGILGGSFDPIHMGHLYMAIQAHEAAELDEVWLIPAGHSPNKEEAGMTDAIHRLRMCEITAKPYDWLLVNSLEIDSCERSYTYRTLEKLAQQFPEHQLYFIMGGDSLDYFEDWKKPERIAELCKILVIPRDAFTLSNLNKKVEQLKKLFPCEISLIPCSRYPLSSTEIRKSLFWNHPKADDFPPGVLEYIREYKLYQH